MKYILSRVPNQFIQTGPSLDPMVQKFWKVPIETCVSIARSYIRQEALCIVDRSLASWSNASAYFI